MAEHTQENYDELCRLAARMYEMVKDTEDVDGCLEPTGKDNACKGECESCE